jgi:BMFP domain-containing protein YqiC
VDSSNPIEDMVNRLSGLLPRGATGGIRQDIEDNLRGGIESGLRTMNLVTREEFEIQNAVLLRTREKLEQLEKQVVELESLIGKINDKVEIPSTPSR